MNRLRAYREIEQISQTELGDLLGISGGMVSQIESGGRKPGDIDWTAIGYAEDRLTLPDMSEPMHRHRASTRVSAMKRARELLRLAGEVFSELTAITPKSPQNMLDRYPTPHSDEDVVRFARNVRTTVLECEDAGPIKNLTAAVERAGICIVPLPNLAGIDGISSWVGDQPVIGMSPTVPGDRFRLTLGHELGHLAMHRQKTPTIEDEANRFSTVMLMSDDEFHDAMPDRPTLRDYLAIKANWGLSVASLVYRSHQEGVLDDKRYRSLQIQMSQKWAKSTEPGAFDAVHGRLFHRLVERNDGADAVAVKLGVNASHLRTLCNWRHLLAL